MPIPRPECQFWRRAAAKTCLELDGASCCYMLRRLVFWLEAECHLVLEFLFWESAEGRLEFGNSLPAGTHDL